MNENLDLVKILRNCPKGTKLNSQLYGEVIFFGLFSDSITEAIEVRLSNGSHLYYTKYGVPHGISNSSIARCDLFPSENQRDWSKFVIQDRHQYIDSLNPFDKVLVRDGKSNVWHIGFFEYVDDCGDVVCDGRYVRECVPYNDETKDLLGTSDDYMEYYKYWKG